MCTLGHVATTRELAAQGIGAFQIRAQLANSRIVRLHRGVYACPHAPPATSIAASIGGAVTCVSVLREAGVWAGDSTLLHIQIPRHAATPRRDDVHAHWVRPRFCMESRWRAGRMQALWSAIHCLDDEDAIAAMESALHSEFLSPAEVRRIGMLAPRRLQPAAQHLVSNSGSGNETIVRRRIEGAGYRVEAQARVPGMGHCDLLIEGCLALEVDGRQWHGEDRYAIDHERDLRAEGLGRHVLRISTSQIHLTWPTTLAVIERGVNEAIRERDRRDGRIILHRHDPL